MLKLISAVALSLLLSFTAEAKGHKFTNHSHTSNGSVGIASWYGPGFHGRKTASGERFNQYAMTAAHKTLPLGSMVRVTNLQTDESVVVRINDRGPYAGGRIIDLSKGAAQALGINGTGRVSLTRLN